MTKSPAEKCAERIAEASPIIYKANRKLGQWDTTWDKAKITAIIQSEYAPTIQVAREAITNALEWFGEPADHDKAAQLIIAQLRTVQEQL